MQLRMTGITLSLVWAILTTPTFAQDLQVPDLLQRANGDLIWISASAATDEAGRLKNGLLQSHASGIRDAITRPQVGQPSAAPNSAPPPNRCGIYFGEPPGNTDDPKTPDELVRTALSILSGRVVDAKEGFLWGSPGSLLLVAGSPLKGSLPNTVYVKHLWGFAKVRYRELLKNTTRAFASFALANLYLVRKYIGPQQERCLC
jgi:hypothetical protein